MEECTPRVRRVLIGWPDVLADSRPSREETVSMATPSSQASVPTGSYAARLEQIAHLHVPETEAEQLWRHVSRHRRELLRRLGRDVGQRVALLDYLLNVHPHHVDATIIETTALDAIERRAISDALTGLYDRGYFEHGLKRELERCHRYGNPVSLLLLDLDEFKEINDEYGHRVGDKVLQEFGDLIRKHLRGADVPCRLEGDEFAIILSDTAQAEAGTVAERFRADVEAWFETHPVCGQFLDRKSTRLNSSHLVISYAVFCLKKKKN